MEFGLFLFIFENILRNIKVYRVDIQPTKAYIVMLVSLTDRYLFTFLEDIAKSI